ncbi:hypothetical protein Ahy_B03g065755 [Arachis hypogaea]|uniref:MULE transposase domain-containing protein n=1 Tax=Arachis hypogaea TaxID=3818 RepID=A0A445A2C2_ARAHY|nr:hypothetical protein Ahy_B03g065755 [Arachis hypogaea]
MNTTETLCHSIALTVQTGMGYRLRCSSVSTTMVSRPSLDVLCWETRKFRVEWVFTQWVTCMGTAPQCIITDQCQCMYGAIRKTLPNTRHRWCIWHIMKKFSQKLGGYRRYREFYVDIRDIVFNSRTEESFEGKCFEFIEEYNLHDSTWLSGL